jgi:hypothetical protein
MRTRFMGGLLLTGLLLLPALPVQAIDKPYPGPYYEDDRMLVLLMPRTPEQMAAFYEARGFPQAALDRIMQTCFITLHIENKSNQVLWVDLGQWQFTSHGKDIARLDENYWQQQWNEINLRQASRSTFGWTQFPTVRDLQPDEPVGGNVVFPGSIDSVTIAAVLHTGANRDGRVIRIGFDDVSCPKGVAAP